MRDDNLHHLLPGDLAPAEAPAAAAALFAWLERAGEGATLDLAPESAAAEAPGAAALQLLAATAKTRRFRAPGFGPRAAAALEALNRPAPVGEGA